MSDRLKGSLCVLFLFVLLGIFFVEVTQAGSFISDSYNGMAYKVFIPGSYQEGQSVPLVVMLHGCTQDPDQFATGTKMNDLAEAENFIVVYPDQPSSANQNKCWNWFEPYHQSRGQGEPAVIVGIVNEVKGNYSIDENRVYVAGLSAGAAMSVILGVSYPDVFAAICVSSGLEYKAATGMVDAFTVMSSGGPDPIQQGNAAYNAMGSYARPVPVIVFHGTSDYTVYPVNGHQVISQWAQTNDLALDGRDNDDIDDTPDETIQGQVTNGYSYTRYIYRDNSGQILMEKYMVDGMGHAWSGGDSSGSYTDPKGPDASRIAWEFFKNHPMGGSDTTPPVTIASPTGGEYSGSVTVELIPNEPATTYYTLDGSIPTVNSLKYKDPITLTGTTTLKFFSVDSSGNSEEVKTEIYTITDDITPPITTANPEGGTYANSVTVELIANEPATIYYTLDGSTPTTQSSIYTDPINIYENTTIKFFGKDLAGNEEEVKSESYNITMTNQAIFTSVGTEDGFAGMFSADGLSNLVHKSGDKGFYNSDTYRTILSFDTSTLPDNAVIENVILRIYRKNLQGTVNNINLDIKSGFYGSSTSLEQGDYNDTSSSTDIVTMPVPSVNDSYSEIQLPAGVFNLINKSGHTQFRLRASTPVDYYQDFLEIYGGESGSFAPVLIIEYGISEDTTPPVTTANPAGGEYIDSVTVELTTDETADTYYTLDGTTPTTASTKYIEPIIITDNTTLKFFSADLAGNTENVRTESYIITTNTDITPPITTAIPTGGTYTGAIEVELTVNEPATTYYTLDGSMPTTTSARYAEPITISENKTLKFFSIDEAGNMEDIQTEVYEIITTTEVSFSSIGAEDGYVSKYMADGKSTDEQKTGDKGMYNLDSFRTILSFDTTSLPDDVIIKSAKLRLYRQSMEGSVNSLTTDIVSGYFGNSSALEYEDYSAPVSANPAKGAEEVVTFSAPSGDNTYTEVALPVSALGFINKMGKTQFRLKAATNYDFTSDLLKIYGGEDGVYAPVLIVTY